MGGKDPIFRLCDTVRETSFELHRYLRHGHLESVYENGLSHRLRKSGIRVQQQVPIAVKDDDGTRLGDFRADLLVDQQLVIELKACSSLIDAHTAQILGYLRASEIEHGLLINFGCPRLQIKKYVSHNTPRL